MNLALKDIRFNLTRFLLTAAGVGFLITAAIGMIGLYRGIVFDALLIVEEVGADLWVVQGGRAGPFAESSAISANMDRRLEGVPGVRSVRRFVQASQQFQHGGREVRATVTGLDFPKDSGAWLRLARGHDLRTGHYTAIADVSLGLAVGDTVRLGLDDYEIVGVTRGMVDSMGDGLMFVSVNDAMEIARRRSSEEILLARAAGSAAFAGVASGSSVPQDSKIAAVLVELDAGADAAAVNRAVLRWGDANILSRADQRDLLLNKRLWRLRIQILAFTAVLLAVMTIVISLIIYTMTLEKLHQIAMLKLIGARNGAIIAMIAEQSALIGIGGFAIGVTLSALIFPYFPRRVVMDPSDLASLFVAVGIICALASLFGISKALKVRAQEVLS